jgi:hypothetical protein
MRVSVRWGIGDGDRGEGRRRSEPRYETRERVDRSMRRQGTRGHENAGEKQGLARNGRGDGGRGARQLARRRFGLRVPSERRGNRAYQGPRRRVGDKPETASDMARKRWRVVKTGTT